MLGLINGVRFLINFTHPFCAPLLEVSRLYVHCIMYFSTVSTVRIQYSISTVLVHVLVLMSQIHLSPVPIQTVPTQKCMNDWTNAITSILFDIRLSVLIVFPWFPENKPRTSSSYFPTIVQHCPYTGLFGLCSVQTGYATILLSTMHDKQSCTQLNAWMNTRPNLA